jgi:hypothetical protein
MGYIGYSMSEGALEAREEGLKTASEIARIAGNGVTAKDVSYALIAEECHHTSCKYNRTNFYKIRISDLIRLRIIAKRRNKKLLNTRELKYIRLALTAFNGRCYNSYEYIIKYFGESGIDCSTNNFKYCFYFRKE